MKDIKGKTFLVTGGTGFLGKNLSPYLTKLGATVYSVGSNKGIFDLSTELGSYNLFKFIDNVGFDYIIHGASLQAAGEWPLKHKAEQYDTNLRIHSNVLKMWKEYQPQAKMIGIISSCAYPGVKEILKEDEYWDGPLHSSVEIYGFTKKAVSVGVEAYKSQYGLKGTSVVFATLFGPHDHFDPEKSHVVSALVKKFVDARILGNPTVEVWGDGSAKREIIYVDDQIKGVVSVLDYDGPLINIGSGVEITIKDLANLIKEVSGYKGEIFFNTTKFVGTKRKLLDVSLAKEKYGWTTTIPLGDIKTNLAKTIEYYESTL